MTEKPPTLTVEDCDKLLHRLWNYPAGPGKKPKRIRNYCIALLMLDAGMRVGEVVALYRDDLFFLNEPRTSLKVHASFSKSVQDRIIPLTDRLRRTIEAHQVNFWSVGPRAPYVYAFTTWKRDEAMSVRHVERIIRDAGMKSLGRPVHPHVFRHTFASRLLRTTNLRVVQVLLGHQNLSSTQIYTHPNSDDLNQAIKRLGDEVSDLGVDVENLAGLDSATDRPYAVHTDRDMG